MNNNDDATTKEVQRDANAAAQPLGENNDEHDESEEEEETAEQEDLL